MRKYLRAIARAKMQREGIQKFNKRPWGTSKTGLPVREPSYFSEHWREYLSKFARILPPL